jgi:hypothetical protein
MPEILNLPIATINIVIIRHVGFKKLSKDLEFENMFGCLTGIKGVERQAIQKITYCHVRGR